MSTTETQREHRHKGRWYQYGLRSFLVFMTLVGLVLGLRLWRINEVRSQREAILESERSAGTFFFFYPLRTEMAPYRLFAFKPRGPAWARLFLADFYFAEEVNLTYSVLWEPKNLTPTLS